MGETSVWDDVLHHGTFNNLEVVESAASKHNGEDTLQEMSFTGSHINDVTKVIRVYHSVCFVLQLFFAIVSETESEACKKTTLKQVTDIEEEWNDSTYTNCELKWKDKGENTEYKGGDSQRGNAF